MTEEQKGFDAVFRQIARFVKYKKTVTKQNRNIEMKNAKGTA